MTPEGTLETLADGRRRIRFERRLRHPIDRVWRAISDPHEIEAWLQATLATWHADPSTLPTPRIHPFFCGPEAWGDGLVDPPADAWPPERQAV